MTTHRGADAVAGPAAYTAAALLTALGGLHVYWARGGKRLAAGVVPTREDRPLFQPSATATWRVAAALLAAASVVLGTRSRRGWGVLHRAVRAGTWGIALVFLARAIGEFHYVGIFKRVKGTQFADRDTRIYVPLCLLLSSLCTVAALASGNRRTPDEPGHSD